MQRLADGEGGDKGGAFNPWAPEASGALTSRREPFTRAPWQPLLLVAILIALYIAQLLTGDPDGAASTFAFVPGELWEGRFTGLVTALFVHGSWTHVIANSVFALAFGTPLARAVGQGWRGGLLFFLFFLVCGVVGNLGYALAHLSGIQPVIGASGGIAGFYGAASRMLGREKGVAPLISSTVLSMGAAWIVTNLLVGLLGVNAGFGAPGGAIAWEAHIAGYFAGLFLVAPILRVFRTA